MNNDYIINEDVLLTDTINEFMNRGLQAKQEPFALKNLCATYAMLCF